jgi:pimeloyl-ACP methyl ester carboxylesterase
LHSYRSRWGEAPVDKRSAALEAKISSTRKLPVPTLFIQGSKDGVTPPSGSAGMDSKFPDCRRVVIKGAGHFLPRESPNKVARQLLRHFSHGQDEG